MTQPPLPPDDPSTSFFWSATRRHELQILRCDACGLFIHWPRPVCRSCLSESLTPATVSGRGTLYSYTVATKPFHPYFVDKVPYLVAVVELAEQPGLRMISNLVDVERADVRIGMELEVTYHDLSDDLTLPLFHPTAAVPA